MRGRDEAIECRRCWGDGFLSCQCIAADDWRDDADLHAVKWNGQIVLVNRLANLAACLREAAGLCLAYDLGYFEQGSATPHWHPGCGHAPITRDARARDDHHYEGDDYDCTLCGEGYCHYLHAPDHKRDEEAERRGAP